MEKIKSCIIIALALVVIALFVCVRCEGDKNRVLNNNIEALTDSVKTYQTKYGNSVSEKKALILERDKFAKYLELSKTEIEALKKDNKHLEFLVKTGSTIKMDTLVMLDTIYLDNDSITTIDFRYNDTYTKLYGTTKLKNNISRTTINELSIDAPLVLGFTDDNRVLVTSDNPNVFFSTIDGAAVENKVKPKRWGIGPYIGVGIGAGGAIGPDANGNIKVINGFSYGFTVGIALHYDLFQW